MKDYNNNPIIIIDSQGFDDTRGNFKDEQLNEAFRFIFSNVLTHINTVCFIAKSINPRLDINTQYVLSSVTNLFSDDISENFIILTTFADKDVCENGPPIIKSIETLPEFQKIKNKKDKKWWYSINSKCILDNDTDRLTKYSFAQLTELYEEKIKKLNPKPIKNCALVLENRHDLKIQIKLLKINYEELTLEYNNLIIKEKEINNIEEQIKNMENQILIFENESKYYNIKELDKKLQELNQELNEKLDKLNNEFETRTDKILESDFENNTICLSCKNNCHVHCNCFFSSSFNRCKVFTWGMPYNQRCKVCGCLKNIHKINHKNIYVLKDIQVRKPNFKQIRIVKEKNKKEREEYINKIDTKINYIDKQKKILEFNKNKLLNNKNKNINEKKIIQKKFDEVNYQLILILVKLQSLSEQLSYLAMNTNHSIIESKYIDSLCRKMKEMGIKNERQIKCLKEIKENNRIFNNIKEIDFSKLDFTQLATKLGFLRPNKIY